jgi:hypothetical protein
VREGLVPTAEVDDSIDTADVSGSDKIYYVVRESAIFDGPFPSPIPACSGLLFVPTIVAGADQPIQTRKSTCQIYRHPSQHDIGMGLSTLVLVDATGVVGLFSGVHIVLFTCIMVVLAPDNAELNECMLVR